MKYKDVILPSIIVALGVIAVLSVVVWDCFFAHRQHIDTFTILAGNQTVTRKGEKYYVNFGNEALVVYREKVDAVLFVAAYYRHHVFTANGQYLGVLDYHEDNKTVDHCSAIQLELLNKTKDIELYSDSARQALFWRMRNGGIKFVYSGAVQFLPEPSSSELMPYIKNLSIHNWYWFAMFDYCLCQKGDKPTMARLLRYSKGKFTKDELRHNGDAYCNKDEIIRRSKITIECFKRSNANIYHTIMHSALPYGQDNDTTKVLKGQPRIKPRRDPFHSSCQD